MLKWNILRMRWLAFSWLLFITLLFFLPGSALPKESWFSKIYLDKWVHTGVFVVLLFLFCSSFNQGQKRYTLLFLMIAAVYGLAVEIVQKNWIPNRDFDLYDLAFDIAGSLIGVWIWHKVYKKNKPL